MDKTYKNNFGYFIEQVVTDVLTEADTPLSIHFEKGWLMVECPWRIRKDKEILLGETDCISDPKKFSKRNIKKLLVHKKIVDIVFYEQLIFVIKFEGDLSFELFHASNYFEGWTLQGSDGLIAFTLPGGEISY